MFKGRTGIIVSFVLGIVLVSFGLYRLSSDVVTCEGRPMAPGHECRVSGDNVPYTYEEQRSSQQRNGVAAVAVGIFLVGYGGWTLGTYLRTRRAREAERLAQQERPE